MQKLNDVGRRGADQKQEASERKPSSQSSSGSEGRADGGRSGSLRTSKTNLMLARILPTTLD